MRLINFAKRNFLEIIRDPLSIIFAILLPLFLLFIFQQFNIPSDVYKIENFTPGIIIFGFSFITLFTASLIAKDRSTSFLVRLAISPMKASDYILGYMLAVLPIVLIQNVLFFIVACLLGLEFSINIILTILVSIPLSILFIGIGILVGCITSDKSAPAVSSVIVQLVVFTSGMYFSAEMLGKVLVIICKILPFESAVNITKGILNANYHGLLSAVLTVTIFTVLVLVLSTLVFKKKMTSDNK